MAQQDLILEVVSKLLQDKRPEIVDELPTVICSLLKPFASKAKPSKQLDELVSKTIQSYGVCSKCRNNRLKQSTDFYCRNCKSVLKDKAKKTIV